ncbi:hypothetical protein [Aliiroseovarius subalbicans]|uniref:glutaredoxin family protein n=1 Tax=Aliiroseovarius subalbicans TaxID=2925840 RepID=UPI001F5790BA|nr:hypothetical protein [Aliiroseovarius subalbicans]MCI2398768.1 hypothetical protein [Aliiroseovarius subalbicans]
MSWIRSLLTAFLLLLPMVAGAGDVTVHLFWQQGCPHCSNAKGALAERVAQGGVVADFIELGVEEADDALFGAVIDHFAMDRAAVPLVVIGGDYALGFAGGGRSTGDWERMIARCQEVPCPDPVSDLRAGLAVAPATQVPPTGPEGQVTLPLLGPVDLGTLSLPVLTVVLAAVDGFNPCAMWVLALLIGLLLGVQDTRRMWTLGAVFLLATGVMYFAVMAAWLNVVLWIGAVGWIRLAIGALAIGAGVYYLREYWTNPEGVCKVTPGGRKKRISDAFRTMVETPNLAVAALGVGALAIAVNLVELACSAGLPAIYTQTLAMHDLPAGGYYGYLALYLAVFLLDDAALFIIAMVTLRAAVTTGRYSRLSHLVGGVVLLVLGAIMVLRPDLLG